MNAPVRSSGLVAFGDDDLATLLGGAGSRSLTKTVTVEVAITAADVLRSLPDEELQAECRRRGIGVLHEAPALTGAQIRGARGLLGWTLGRLAASSSVSVSTVKRMEDGSEGQTRPGKVQAIRHALESGGVVFRTVDGVTCLSRTSPATVGTEKARVPA